MTVRAKVPQVDQQVVAPVPIHVVDLQDQRLAQPLTRITATDALVDDTALLHCPVQEISRSPDGPLWKDNQNLSRRTLVGWYLVDSLEMSRVDLEVLQPSSDVSVRSWTSPDEPKHLSHADGRSRSLVQHRDRVLLSLWSLSRREAIPLEPSANRSCAGVAKVIRKLSEGVARLEKRLKL